MSDLTRRQRYLLNQHRQQKLENMLQYNPQYVNEFRRQIELLNYSIALTQTAYSLFLTDIEEITKMDKSELDWYPIVFKGKQIPQILRKKYQTVLSCLSFFHIPLLSRLWSGISSYFKSPTKSDSKRLMKNIENKKHESLQEQQQQLLSKINQKQIISKVIE